ncbi:MAG: hydrogenase large subunit [Candidatus Magnetoglobus multicellularis str. Araruama]|uniref:Hydrogenase large subunit n=1 Tax=Candidatus Magnetoglobus multicellularis str. Araruama TaxID=890399 RepID=A0A1V1PC52_9BACT|nr:MAG: hydrogenase large subunit [Candidatus Magnetoglobus multicellularis str. Araruama]
MKTIHIDPITRIEGHLAIRTEIESNLVTKAYSAGEMFRGFEIILQGRDPMDAQQITQRICGVCPISHGVASILAQDMAYAIHPPENGRLMRNILQAANYIQSHIIHFYHLSAPDFVDIKAINNYQGKDPALKNLKAWVETQLASKSLYPAAPFLPTYDAKYIEDSELNFLAIKHYLDAFKMRRMAHKLGALLGGKLPHSPGLIPGGITENITAYKIASIRSLLAQLQHFIDTAYIPDVLEVANAFHEYFDMGKGYGNFLAYGVFAESNGKATYLPSGCLQGDTLTEVNIDKITEDVQYSYYSSASGLKPQRSETVPAPDKNDAYSWIKAPRYDGQVMEVGPLARMMVAYHRNHSPAKQLIDSILSGINKAPADLISMSGRHAARAIECKLIADHCSQWIDQLVPGKPVCKDFEIPKSARGIGLTEAPRGALGHWLEIDNYKISHYQCVVPTTWNCSPRDDKGNPGAVEKALEGTPVADPDNPIEPVRVVRSFDPCIACAVH